MRGHTIRGHGRRGVQVAVLAWLGLALSPQPGLAQGTATPPGDPTHTRAAFLQMIERPRVPLAPQSKALPDTEGLAHEHCTFAAAAEQRVPGLLLKPAAGGGRRYCCPGKLVHPAIAGHHRS